IDAIVRRRGIRNLRIVTADINGFRPKDRFDRIVSVEMFEHMRNYEMLFQRIHSWLKPRGKLFVHVFTHRMFPYLFEDRGADDWMSRYFFSGGTMPSNFLFAYFAKGFQLSYHRIFSGMHYHLTAEHWLKNLDAKRNEVLAIFARVYGAENSRRWFHYWRVFFLAVSELFRTRHGEEWNVSHYLFEKV
ncbi:MAG: class I SAM-dependent methyltransferase, partial [Leptospiraceae bacterium]|nr:class I SAM-dependent methyltransferase [Leptospiraceae bacterium]